MLFLIDISILNYLYNPSPSHNTLGWPRTPLCYHSILFSALPHLTTHQVVCERLARSR